MEFGFVLDTVGSRTDDSPNYQSSPLDNDFPLPQSSRAEDRKKLKKAILSGSNSDSLSEYKRSLFESTTINAGQPNSSAIGFKEKEQKEDKKPLIRETQIGRATATIAKRAKGHAAKQLSLEVQKALSKAVVTPDFEQLQTVPPYELSKKKLQQERKKEREKTKGTSWFGLPAPEMTDEVKQDLEILQMRSVLDPKHFYKKNDLKVLPKYFQIGKVMDSPLDFYNNRLTKKERKKTLVDELLADAEFQKYNKKKYKVIMEEKQKTHYKSWKKAKNLKRKKK